MEIKTTEKLIEEYNLQVGNYPYPLKDLLVYINESQNKGMSDGLILNNLLGELELK